MIVGTLIKFLFFYLIFVFIRNLLRGASKVNQVKQQMKAHMDQMNGNARGSFHQQSSPSNAQAKAPTEDIVDAEFRHL